ncbi:phosphoesterase [Aerococcus urinaehominis]|uniref:Phosphoesterase n=1 Tax=Aerococcus urinaehominis TaxID=128944 RepID=A0A0X8FKE6_9LACT|nr:bifunctional oligoribonuclease/PAP phosphatase NrnA [Aerococcus urinaehominis]AMB98930.1 phosphoesterase [Aerococcus urinaehominis]SDM40088.1 phosphoesterase RecJ domain-containing protein [Aerococcus urinaehominis]
MLNQLLTDIKNHATIIIHRHLRPDPDALGSQLGLKQVLQASFPEKEIYAVGENDHHIVGFEDMDQISDQVYQEALVIVTDTANTPRIDDQRYQTGQKVIKIDHHPNHDVYGDWQWVDDQVSSASELIASFVLASQGQLQMTDQAAQYFFLGIVGDTGRFLYDNTSPETMKIAGQLRAYDFPATELMQAANTQSLAQAQLLAYVLGHLEIDDTGAVAWVSISQDCLKTIGLSESETYHVVQTPGSIAGVRAWVTFVEQPAGHWRCRIRSKGPVINTIAMNHDGGGHEKAAGANAYSDQEKLAIVKELVAVSQSDK